METGVVIVLIIVGLGIYLWNKAREQGYRDGKREGSRKGFGVGFDRGRRSGKGQSQAGCSLLVVALALLGSVLAALSQAATR